MFEDKLNENIEQRKENKTNLTSPIKRPFLAKRGGGVIQSEPTNKQLPVFSTNGLLFTNKYTIHRKNIGEKDAEKHEKVIPVNEKLYLCFKSTPDNFKAGKIRKIYISGKVLLRTIGFSTQYEDANNIKFNTNAVSYIKTIKFYCRRLR